jgi:hypothetical protein
VQRDLEGKTHQGFSFSGIESGLHLQLNGLPIYCSGGTLATAQMAGFAARRLDYALLCGG